MFAANADTTTPHDLVAASQRLLHAVHHDRPTEDLFSSLAALQEGVLSVLTDDQRAAKAFWLNVHGAFVADESAGDTRGVSRSRIDAETIRHRILRARKWKYGFGYLPNPFAGQFARTHSLDDVDPRIHFAALAARHAPQLAGTYTATDVNAELADVTVEYLEAAVAYDDDSGVAHIPGVFFWHRGDFGGRTGVRQFLVDHDALPPTVDPWFTYGSLVPDVESESAPRRTRERRQ